MKKLINSFLGKFGYKIQKVDNSAILQYVDVNTMKGGFHRTRDLGLFPNTIVDVGAAEGTWTEKAAKMWPEADFLLFEPLEERKSVLNELRRKLPNRLFFSFAAAGNKDSEVIFHVSEDLDGSGIATDSTSASNRVVKVTTIDSMIAMNKLQGPYAIKLDTHGFEVPILEGATETLKNTSFVIIESYGFYIAPGSLLISQMTEYMNALGFRLFDIVDIMRRPGDQAFWQADAFFIRKDNPVFDKNSYA